MSIACGFGSADAVDLGDIDPRASRTLSEYNAGLRAGSSSGEIRISYDVSATNIANSIGVLSIAVYKSDGSYVATITGTTGNGLVINSGSTHDSARMEIDIDFHPCFSCIQFTLYSFTFIHLMQRVYKGRHCPQFFIIHLFHLPDDVTL